MKLRALLRWWRAPLWLLAIATGAKSFVDNPILGSKRLNRHGLHTQRLRIAHGLARSRRQRLARNVPDKVRAEFDINGFVEIRDFLPRDEFSALQEVLLGRQFETREQQQGNAITRRVAITPQLLRDIPQLRALQRDPALRSLLAYAASTRAAPIYYIQTIIMGESSGAPDPQLELHADTFHPSLKAWLFLTDVTDDEGPLTYVPGSHRLTPQRLAWERQRSIAIQSSDRLSQRGSLRVSPDELAALGLPDPIRFAVPANTLVVIDTCGFHARGSCTKPTVRAEIWAYVRRTPFIPWTGLDLLSLPLLANRRSSWLLDGLDRLDRLGLLKQHWQRSGRKRVADH